MCANKNRNPPCTAYCQSNDTECLQAASVVVPANSAGRLELVWLLSKPSKQKIIHHPNAKADIWIYDPPVALAEAAIAVSVTVPSQPSYTEALTTTTLWSRSASQCITPTDPTPTPTMSVEEVSEGKASSSAASLESILGGYGNDLKRHTALRHLSSIYQCFSQPVMVSQDTQSNFVVNGKTFAPNSPITSTRARTTRTASMLTSNDHTYIALSTAATVPFGHNSDSVPYISSIPPVIQLQASNPIYPAAGVTFGANQDGDS